MPVVSSAYDSLAFAAVLSPTPIGPFPPSAHRTGHADLPHPALQWDHAPCTRNAGLEPLPAIAGHSRYRWLVCPRLPRSCTASTTVPLGREMSRAVDGSMEALGLEGHEALIVAHDDTRHPHVHVIANRVDPETGKAATLGRSKLRLSRWAEGYEREQGRIRCERRVRNNERRRAGKQVLRPTEDRPRHWARVRREGTQPGRARRARGPRDEERVDMEAWRRAEAEAWEKFEEGREWGLRRLDARARKEWAELHRRQEEMRQRVDRESRTVLGRLRIWRTERSLRELVAAVRGREDLVEGWREDLARNHRDERTALGKEHGGSAKEIERGERESYRRGLVDAERLAWAVRERMRERQETRERERGRTLTPVPPRLPRPRGPERGGRGFAR